MVVQTEGCCLNMLRSCCLGIGHPTGSWTERWDIQEPDMRLELEQRTQRGDAMTGYSCDPRDLIS